MTPPLTPADFSAIYDRAESLVSDDDEPHHAALLAVARAAEERATAAIVADLRKAGDHALWCAADRIERDHLTKPTPTTGETR